MISINEGFVESAAPNAEAAKNGRALVLKNKFLALHRSPDDALLFGECQGSGKTPYLCSADFAAPDKPVYRCSCPSRQFPCKHSLGLLFAYAQGKTFTAKEVPTEISAKREKVAARVEKKKEDAAKPKKVNLSALAKKIEAQLEGIELLEKLTRDLVRTGIGNTNAKTARELEEHAKQLGNAYLPGAQTALRNYTKLFRSEGDEELPSEKREAVYADALDQLARLHALIGKGRAYLQRRLEDPELAPEVDTDIAAWLGHAWQLRELREAGLVEAKAELVQLAFNTHYDVARQEYVDTGIWMQLASGRIYTTQNYRPLHAVKFIRSDDSFFDVAQVEELCVYPGDVNPRVRWEGMVPRPTLRADLSKIRSHGRTDFAATIKEVKSRLKNPLGDKHPILALGYRRIGRVGHNLVLEDGAGARLALTDVGITEEPKSCHLLSLLPSALFEGQVMIVRFRHDLDQRKLRVKPLSIVTEAQVLRLTL